MLIVRRCARGLSVSGIYAYTRPIPGPYEAPTYEIVSKGGTTTRGRGRRIYRRFSAPLHLLAATPGSSRVSFLVCVSLSLISLFLLSLIPVHPRPSVFSPPRVQRLCNSRRGAISPSRSEIFDGRAARRCRKWVRWKNLPRPRRSLSSVSVNSFRLLSVGESLRLRCSPDRILIARCFAVETCLLLIDAFGKNYR